MRGLYRLSYDLEDLALKQSFNATPKLCCGMQSGELSIGKDKTMRFLTGIISGDGDNSYYGTQYAVPSQQLIETLKNRLATLTHLGLLDAPHCLVCSSQCVITCSKRMKGMCVPQ